MSQFDWDERKARDNVTHHGVSFEEAESVPDTDLARWFPDHAHSAREERYIVIGPPRLAGSCSW